MKGCCSHPFFELTKVRKIFEEVVQNLKDSYTTLQKAFESSKERRSPLCQDSFCLFRKESNAELERYAHSEARINSREARTGINQRERARIT